MSEHFEINIAIEAPNRDAVLVAPLGLDMPSSSARGLEAFGGTTEFITEPHTRQRLMVLRPEDNMVTLTYLYDGKPARYADEIFAYRETRFSRAAQSLIDEAHDIGALLPPLLRAQAIASAVAEKFTYGHPQERFNDGMDHVPMLGCDIRTPGSCVDINTYFIACLRAVGIDAGYVLGYFFPQEKGTHCQDAHCWVVTRIGGRVQEWDIAHHLKMGTRDIQPATNPKPGFRAAVSHSMGLDLPEFGLKDIKLIGEPVWVRDGTLEEACLDIRLAHPAIAA